MKKYLVIILIFTAFADAVKAQQIVWDSVGSSWGLNGNFGGVTPTVECMTVYNNKLYAGGEFIMAGYAANINSVEVNCIGSWDGTRWDSLGSGMLYSQLGPYALAVYNGDLYVGGADISTAGGLPVHNIAKWNGTSWSKVGSGVSVNGGINAMAIYNGNLYVGGEFDTAGGIPVNNIAMWNGTKWSAVGTGITGLKFYTSVNALFVYNGDLYVGGEFTTAGGNPASDIATWNGTSWSTVGGGIRYGSYGSVNAITEYNGNLYAGGTFDSAGNTPAKNIARWNGSTWSALANGITDYYYASVQALCSYNNFLYVGGRFDMAGNIPDSGGVAAWDGTKWAYVSGFKGTAYNGDIPTVYCFVVYNGYIFAGGYFDSTSTFLSFDIAGNFPSTAGVNSLTNSISSISIYPNPSNGKFNLSLSHSELVSESQTTIEIYNVLGEEVYNATLKQVQGDNTIDLSNQPNGVYLYRLISQAGNPVGEGKIVIEK